MMRLLMFFTTALLVAGLGLRATTARPAESGIPFGPDQLEFVAGLSPLERVQILRQALPLLHRIEECARQVPGAPPARQEELRREVEDLAQGYRTLLREHLTPAQLAQAERLPRESGPREKALRGRVLELTLSAEQKEGLSRLLAAADRADRPGATPEQGRLRRERYWTLVALQLDPEQAAALRARLPHFERGPEDYLFLPGMTASQGNRIVAGFRTLEAETTDRVTRARQLEARVAQADGRERLQLHQEMLDIQLEMMQRRQELQAQVEEVLTPSQRQALASLPWGVSAPRFYELAASLIRPDGLQPAQLARLQEWAQPLQARHEAVREELARRAQEAAETTLESDEGMGRMMAVRQLEQPLREEQRQVAARLATLLTEPQLSAWLEAPEP